MRKGLKIVALLLALAGCFMLGWRVMPNIWPAIKTNVVYRVFPAMEPTPAPTQEPYSPKANASLNDPVSLTDSLIYYFYRPTCSYCRAIAPLMDGLPAQITLSDGTVSQVKVVAVNKSSDEGLALIEGYYTDHEIPDDSRLVPSVLIGDQYLMGSANVIGGLLDALMAGEGLTTPLFNGQERQPVTE